MIPCNFESFNRANPMKELRGIRIKFHSGGGGYGEELFLGAIGLASTLADQEQVISKVLDLIKIMGSEQHSGPLIHTLTDIILQHLARLRIETGGWFVEKN